MKYLVILLFISFALLGCRSGQDADRYVQLEHYGSIVAEIDMSDGGYFYLVNHQNGSVSVVNVPVLDQNEINTVLTVTALCEQADQKEKHGGSE